MVKIGPVDHEFALLKSLLLYVRQSPNCGSCENMTFYT